MQKTIHQHADTTVMTVSGRLDAVSAPEFERDCSGYSDARIVLDLSGLEYVSSAGLRSILTLAKQVKSGGGSLAIAGLNGLVKDVFEMSGFDSFLPLYSDLDAALAASPR
ncbi:putative anti-sigma factor antagonist BtrV [compost metagenome]